MKSFFYNRYCELLDAFEQGHVHPKSRNLTVSNLTLNANIAIKYGAIIDFEDLEGILHQENINFLMRERDRYSKERF